MDSRIVHRVWCAVVMMFPIPALSELSINGAFQSSFTDNAALDPEDSAEEFGQQVDIDVAYAHESKRLLLDADYLLSHSRYLKNEFQNETNFTGQGNLVYHLLPSNFDWHLTFNREVFVDGSNVPNTPSNRSVQSHLITGPSYRYEITDLSRLDLEGRYQKSENGSSIGGDSERLSLSALYANSLSQVTLFNARAEVVDVVEFEGFSEYRKESFSMGIRREFRRGYIDVNAGTNRVVRESSQQISDKYFDVTVERELYNNLLRLSLTQEITDSAIGLSVRALLDSGFDSSV